MNAIDIHPNKPAGLSNSNTADAVSARRSFWADIQKQFVASGPAKNPWTADQICTWFKNCRQRSRNKAAQLKASIRATGGGPPPRPLPAGLQKVAEIVGDNDKPLANDNCSDAGFYQKDETVPADKYSPYRKHFSTPTSIKLPAEHKTMMPAAKRVKYEPDYRQAEHGLIMDKLQAEIRVLGKKEQLLDLQIAYYAGTNLTNGQRPVSAPASAYDSASEPLASGSGYMSTVINL